MTKLRFNLSLVLTRPKSGQAAQFIVRQKN